MNTRQLLFSAGFALLTTSVISGEARCPGKVETIRYHSIGRSQITVSITINGSGPYEFLVDTGSQVTIVEPSLAAELDLKPAGDAEVYAVGNRSKAELVIPEIIALGPLAVRRPMVVVQNLNQIQASLAPKVRGLLGGSFLAHFDLLIDYTHKVLCLDETKQMRENVRGEQVPLKEQADLRSDRLVAAPLLIPVRILGEYSRDVSLMLDSGSSVPLLYTTHLATPAWRLREHTLVGSAVGRGSRVLLAFLPLEDVRIGSRSRLEISFVVPVGNRVAELRPEADGLLPTNLFKRVFISYTDHFVILDPR